MQKFYFNDIARFSWRACKQVYEWRDQPEFKFDTKIEQTFQRKKKRRQRWEANIMINQNNQGVFLNQAAQELNLAYLSHDLDMPIRSPASPNLYDFNFRIVYLSSIRVHALRSNLLYFKLFKTLKNLGDIQSRIHTNIYVVSNLSAHHLIWLTSIEMNYGSPSFRLLWGMGQRDGQIS